MTLATNQPGEPLRVTGPTGTILELDASGGWTFDWPAIQDYARQPLMTPTDGVDLGVALCVLALEARNAGANPTAPAGYAGSALPFPAPLSTSGRKTARPL